MAKRKRDYIPLEQLLAAALSLLLTQEERDELRAAKAPAKSVTRLFTPDHIRLHCMDGSDRWWNLDMRRRGPAVLEKNKRDTSIAAKAVRIDEKWSAFTRMLSTGIKPPKRKSRWAKRPMRNVRKMVGRKK